MAVPGEEEGREGQQGGGSSSSRQRGRQERQRVEFAVGRYCCGRLAAYHALFHYRHRLQARLKRELKSELRTRKVRALQRLALSCRVVLACCCRELRGSLPAHVCPGAGCPAVSGPQLPGPFRAG